MNNLIKYVFYVAIGTGTAIGVGCSSREPEILSLNGIESRVIGIEPIYDWPKFDIIGIEPIYDEPKEKDNKTESYKR